MAASRAKRKPCAPPYRSRLVNLMQTRRYRLLVAVLCQWLALIVVALAPVRAEAAPTHIAAELLAPESAAPGGTATLVLLMTPEPTWHGYWTNPGDAGLGMQLDWDLPPGAKAGEPSYPVPHVLMVQGLMNHVYEGQYAVLVPLTLPAEARPGAVLLVSVKAQWLACTEEICVPERADLSVSLPVLRSGEKAPADDRLARWRQALPAPLDRKAAFRIQDGKVHLAIPLPASVTLTDPHLFVADDKLVDYAAPQTFARQGDTLIVTLPRARFAARDSDSLRGVLRLDGEGNGLSFSAVKGKVPTGGVPVETAAPDLPAMPLLLLGALLGGLLLNVMPCVFPILSLKALSLARAGESEAHARIEGLAYAAGVIAACLLLGGLLLALRAGGAEIGWAFQLQEPLVVAALFLLAVAITANLLGLYEFAVPGFAASGSARSYTQGAFATGLLAGFVATPCTGPFMATAMGAALLLPVMPAMALFAALGLGIALPFLAVAFVPALRRRLPKPGAWMIRLRRWLAVPMGLTALALAWLLWKIGGWAFAGVALGFAALIGLLLLRAGTAQRAGRSARAPALAAAAVALLALPILPTPEGSSGSGASILDTRPFSEAALEQARAKGKPVFVYMTADWCLTCKVNESAAIEREETKAAFDKAGVVVLRGDWTRRDPEITRYLTANDAAGVPLYVWYGRDGKGEQLPQVLTASLLAEKAGR